LKFIPSDQIAIVKDDHYERLNESVLEILGQIEAKIFGEEISTNTIVFRIFLCPTTQSNDAILGRDTIRVLGLKLSKLEGERKTETPEILNVEHSISDRDELNKIDINPETSSETRDRFFYHFYLFHEVYTRRKTAKGQNQNKDICQGLFTLRREDSYVKKRRLREILNVVC